MTIPKRIGTIFIFAALGSISGLACAAGNISKAFDVTANVASNCLISSASDMVFGTYDPTTNSDKTSTSIIIVKCTKNKFVTIGLNQGTGINASVVNRNMTPTLPGNDPLPYSLHYDPAMSANWGDTQGTSKTETGAGLNTDIVVTVYGKILKNLYNLSEDTYKDTITATVNF